MGVITNSSGSDREVAAVWDLRLDQDSYVAGETVRATVVLNVHEPIAFESAIAEVSGIETITWVEESGTSNGEVSAASYSRRSEALRDKVVLAGAASAYPPGTYEFPLECTLPKSIPGTFQFKSVRIGGFERISTELSYMIRVSTRGVCDESGESTENVVNSFPITVLRPPTWRPRNVRALANAAIGANDHQSAALQRSISSDLIQATSAVDECSLSAIIDSVTHFPSDTIKVLCRIDHDPSAAVDLEAVSLRFFKDLEIQVAADKKEETSKVVCEQRFPLSVESPPEQVLSLDLLPLPSDLAPSLNSCFVQWQYRLVVSCESTDKQQSPTVEFPVAILS